jgi:Tol biopolymer transport system component/mono/diheme cytochrome c family protein
MRSWQVFAIIGGVIAAVAVGGWLLGRGVRPLATGVSQSAQAGDMRVTVRVDDTTVGSRVIDVTVDDANGRPADIGGVKLRFSMVDMDMGTSEVKAQPVGTGHFQARGPFFTMVGNWRVDTVVLRDGQTLIEVPFTMAIAARGEASGPANPLKSEPQTLLAGQKLYVANCAVCHGQTGKGDGPTAASLNPRPTNFSQHMAPGQHTDGQIFLWISDGYPNTAMPAWKARLTEEQIWQLVTYLRTFGQGTAPAQASGTTQPQASQQPAPVPNATEPMPPLVFTRQGNVWRSDGSGEPPRQLTNLEAGAYAQYPSFSPDGRRVAFIAISPPPETSTLPLPSSALLVMNADGSDLRTIWKPAQGLLGLPTWAADGQAIFVAGNGLDAQSSSGRQLQVLRVDLATGAQQPIVSDALDPALSRDGKQLAYLKLSADGYTMTLIVAAPDGSGARELIGGADFQGFYAPRFSPDGKRIVVAAIGGPQTDAQGAPIKAGAPSVFDRLLGLFEPATAEAHGLPWDLWAINTDGSDLRRLTRFNEDLPMAAFSPDGKQIVVLAAGGMYLMDADGGRLRRIDPTGDHGGLDWAR